MATIAVMIDSEEGHVLASFWLFRYLRACGHRVCYLSPPAAEAMIRSQGFECMPLVSDALLKMHQFDRDGKVNDSSRYSIVDMYFSSLARGKLLDESVAKLQPDVLLVLSLYYAEGLITHYRYKLPVVFFTPHLPAYNRIDACKSIIDVLCDLMSSLDEVLELLNGAGARFNTFNDIAQLVLNFPELMLFPEAFDLPGRDKGPKVYYLGAGVDVARTEKPFDWTGVNAGLPLIYCSRGSQAQLCEDVNRRFFQSALDAAAARPDWQFIISVGNEFNIEDLADIPPNVILRSWVPQLEVLSRSNVMVNHGGLGSIKECILMGVPMVVLTLEGFRDQATCAERVVYHGLGVRSDVSSLSSGELVLLIERVISDQSFNRRVNLMRERFEEQDRLELAATVIENAISAQA